jgi:hypothetical protein
MENRNQNKEYFLKEYEDLLLKKLELDIEKSKKELNSIPSAKCI